MLMVNSMMSCACACTHCWLSGETNIQENQPNMQTQKCKLQCTLQFGRDLDEHKPE